MTQDPAKHSSPAQGVEKPLSDASADYRQAVVLHQHGRLAEAEAAYRQILQTDPIA